jgi:hypothetical protein
MYKLIKILNARINVPEIERISLESAVTVCRAMPVIIAGGTLTVFSSKSERLPTHMTLADTSGKEVFCYPLTPDMVFEVSAAQDPTGMKVGSEYLLSEDGKSITAAAASGGYRGATLMNKNGAKATGDSLLVSFR